MALFRPKYSHQWLLPVALAYYMLSKLLEAYDREVFVYTWVTRLRILMCRKRTTPCMRCRMLRCGATNW